MRSVIAAVVALSLAGCSVPVQSRPGWVLVENPRYGTLDAKPDEREYVWVREDRATGLTVADPSVARRHLPAPGPLSPSQGLAFPAVDRVKIEALGGRTVNATDDESCRREAAMEVPDVAPGPLSTVGLVLGLISLSPFAIASNAAAIEQKREAARQDTAWRALENYRSCMRARGYRVDGVSSAEVQRAVPASPNADCPLGLVRSRGGGWCVVE